MKNNYSVLRKPVRANLSVFTKLVLFALLPVLSNTPIQVRAATAPPATLIYSDANNASIHGGNWRAFFLPIDCTTLGGVITYQIPALPGVTRTDWNSAAYGVNTNGLVVGYAQNQSLANRAFIYSAQTGITTDLNTFTLDGGQTPASLGWTLTSAVAINDAGVMVGYGSNATGNTCWIIYPKCQD